MADFDSSLPIRTQNDGDVVAKIADKTIPSQQLAVGADGSINVTDNGGSLTVDAVNLDIRDLAFATDKVDVSGSSVTVSATDLDIRDLTHVSDSVKVGDGSDFLAINADGSLNITDNGGSLTVDANNLDIRDLAFATDKVDVSGSSVTVSATDLDIRNLSASQDNVAISDGTDQLAINGDGSLNAVVSATDLDIRDLSHSQDSVKVGDGTDFLAVNADGSINVNISDSTPGTPVNDYKAASAVAAAASDNHDYTVTALKTLTFNQVWASASGKAKLLVQVETGVASGVFNTRFAAFNSTANPVMDLHLDNPISVAAGVRVRLVMTNLDNQAQDLYSTICGYELP